MEELEDIMDDTNDAADGHAVHIHAEDRLSETVLRNVTFAQTNKFFGEMLEIRKLLNLRPHGRSEEKPKFLDVGCGVGGVREHFAPDVEYYGFDLAPLALQFAEPEYHESIWLDNVEEMHSPRKNMDIAVMSHLIEHLYRPEQALLNIAGCLALGGKLVVLTPNAWFVNVHRPTNRLRGYRIDPTTVQFWSVRSLRKILHRCGYKVEQCYTFGKSVLGQRERLIALATKGR